MLMNKNKLALAVTVALSLAAPSAFATNGYFAHGYGTKNKGLSGAGVALPQDAMAAATNPAGMVFVGDRMDIGLAFFSPNREYTVSGASGPVAPPNFNLVNGTAESDNTLFYIPHLGYNKMLDANSSVGVTVYGNGGMNTDYAQEATGGGMGTFLNPGATGVNLSQLFVAATYARKLVPNASIGASVILAYQQFEAFGLQNFANMSTNQNNLSNNGTDSSTGYGLKLGGQMDVGAGVTLGASYQTKMSMGEFDSYSGLFAEAGGFDIPATATIGAAFKINPQHAVVLDMQKIYYNDVAAIGNPFSNIDLCAPGSMSYCLGGANGAGFGWQDITVYKLGYQFEASPAMTWRVGYSKGDQPIPSSEVLFNILAPAVQEQHYTVGGTWSMSKTREVNFTFMYSPSNTVSGPNPLALGSQTIDLTMMQYELEVSYGMKF
jgi:long-chain fatty acid transport protein